MYILPVLNYDINEIYTFFSILYGFFFQDYEGNPVKEEGSVVL